MNPPKGKSDLVGWSSDDIQAVGQTGTCSCVKRSIWHNARMKIVSALLSAGALLSACGSGAHAPARAERVVDLGHALNTTDPSWDGVPAFARRAVATFDKDGYSAGQVEVEEHFGTHLDAPAHFAAGGLTVDAIPPERLVRPAVVIDVSAKAAQDADYRVAAADIQQFESAHGTIPEGTVVLIATGWDRFWPDRSRYMGEVNRVKHFPGLSVEAVTILAKERRVAGIGIDTGSIDYGPSTGFEAHHVSMAAGVYHIENAANLTPLPSSGFRVVVAPMKIAGGSGGPTRLFALLP
jgi:kynurenine formamidase